MKRFEFNKLIRNKLPERMIQEGIKVNAKVLNKEEYIFRLKDKLIEEAQEVKDADSIEQLIVELADVLEVFSALAKAFEISMEKIKKAKVEKQKVNGTFDSKSFINYIEVPEDNNKVINYLLSKNRPFKLV